MVFGSPAICWTVTSGLWYPGYKTPTVAPEPSVEWVVGAVHSMGGRIGTHMSLRVPPRDSVVRARGYSLNGRDSKSRSGTHRVAPEAAAKLKARMEPKFHMYYFGLRWRLMKPLDLSGLSKGCAACTRVTPLGSL
jgi:hypothetical protein